MRDRVLLRYFCRTGPHRLATIVQASEDGPLEVEVFRSAFGSPGRRPGEVRQSHVGPSSRFRLYGDDEEIWIRYIACKDCQREFLLDRTQVERDLALSANLR